MYLDYVIINSVIYKFLEFKPEDVLASAVHILKLERYRED